MQGFSSSIPTAFRCSGKLLLSKCAYSSVMSMRGYVYSPTCILNAYYIFFICMLARPSFHYLSMRRFIYHLDPSDLVRAITLAIPPSRIPNRSDYSAGFFTTKAPHEKKIMEKRLIRTSPITIFQIGSEFMLYT